jgi:thiamine-monophosphate kinase
MLLVLQGRTLSWWASTVTEGGVIPMTNELPALSAEDRVIARYFRPLAKHPGALGLIDDAALLTPPPGCDIVLTTDAIVGGVHFFPEDSADMVAKKALRVNLSDLAAKGAAPAGFLLALALPRTTGEDWIELFARGLGADADSYACPLLGGDSVRTTGPVTISITALGTVPHGTMVPRSGARVGDRIVVTGTIGDAALGLVLRVELGAGNRWRLETANQYGLMRRYLLPLPRNALAESLRLHASAAMDVSDGLAGDLAKLCSASGVSADVLVDHVPLSDAVKSVLAAEPARIETVLTGGDDYEIVCTIAPDKIAPFRAAAIAAGVPMAEIGRVVEGNEPPRFMDHKGNRMLFKRTSFSHF